MPLGDELLKAPAPRATQATSRNGDGALAVGILRPVKSIVCKNPPKGAPKDAAYFVVKTRKGDGNVT